MNGLGGGISAMVAAWIVFGLAFALNLATIPPLLRQSYGRVSVVFAPLLALGVLLAWSLLSFFGVKVETAATGLVGGTIIALGWIVTYLVTDVREEGVRDKNRRETLVALRSEVFALVDKLDNQDIEHNAGQVQARILAGEPDGEYFPFSTMDSAPIVFSAIAHKVPSLEGETTVDDVIRFYAEYTDLRQLIDDLRQDEARGLPRERRVGLHRELTRRRISTLRWGLRAIVSINAELGVAAPENVQRSGLNPQINP